MDDSDLYICKECWLIGTPKIVSKGSTFVEILLWGLFLIPGILYSAWRFMTKEKMCPQCSSLAVIPLNSEIGQRVLEKIYGNKTGFQKGQIRSQQASFKAGKRNQEEVFNLIKNPEQKGSTTNIQ